MGMDVFDLLYKLRIKNHNEYIHTFSASKLIIIMQTSHLKLNARTLVSLSWRSVFTVDKVN